jgi:hypothetical protein
MDAMRRLPHEVSAPRANATARNTIWTGTHQFYLPWMQFPRMYCSVAAAQAVTELFLCRRPLFDTLEHLAVATEDAIMVGQYCWSAMRAGRRCRSDRRFIWLLQNSNA